MVPVPAGCAAPSISSVLLVVAAIVVAAAALTSLSVAALAMMPVPAGCAAPSISSVLLAVSVLVTVVLGVVVACWTVDVSMLKICWLGRRHASPVWEIHVSRTMSIASKGHPSSACRSFTAGHDASINFLKSSSWSTIVPKYLVAESTVFILVLMSFTSASRFLICICRAFFFSASSFVLRSNATMSPPASLYTACNSSTVFGCGLVVRCLAAFCLGAVCLEATFFVFPTRDSCALALNLWLARSPTSGWTIIEICTRLCFAGLSSQSTSHSCEATNTRLISANSNGKGRDLISRWVRGTATRTPAFIRHCEVCLGPSPSSPAPAF